jgi:uncharacterized damage-inducible protein DinB
MPLVDMLLPEFDHEMATTRKLLERVPDDRLGWAPHARSFTMGQLAQHVATIPMWGTMTLAQSELDLAGSDRQAGVASRDELVKIFDDNAVKARSELVGKTDAELMAPWTLKHGENTIFSMPKISVWRGFVMSHLIHHRAQLSVYLRMQDVPVPAMYGPSADEQAF